MLRSYIYLIICVIIWGSNFIFGKILLQYFSPSMTTMLRLIIIVIFLLSLSVFYGQKKPISYKKDIILLLVLGVVGVFINQWSFFIGLETADPTTAALILAMTPILTAFLAGLFLKEKITLRMGLGSVIAILGIFYVVTNGQIAQIHIDPGLFWIMITMVTFSVMIIITRHLGQRLDAFSITLYSNIIGMLVSVPFGFFYDQTRQISNHINGWLLLISTAIVVHAIATLMWNNHIRNVNASNASILSNLEPFVAMVVGFIILAKPITLIELFGGLLIVSGVILSTYRKKRIRFRNTIVSK